VAAVVLVAIGVALAWLAHSVFGEARHPVDTAPWTSVSTAVIFSLTAAMFLGAGAWALLGGHGRQGRLVSVAAPATTLTVLPWTAVAGDWGVAVNVVAGVVAVVSWRMASGRGDRGWPARRSWRSWRSRGD
jgi:hypothetical protein